MRVVWEDGSTYHEFAELEHGSFESSSGVAYEALHDNKVKKDK